MFTFTKDQKTALDFPGNVIISAGAGSGKTRVLVEKYFRLLVDQHPDWPVESVVAITFTRKAASELKSRIIARVLGELEKPGISEDRRARLIQVRADVGAAPIGTIHTFCGRILKEFAFDARLNPDFAIVEGARESALKLNAARNAVADATADAGGELYTALLALLNVMSPSTLHALLARMLGSRTAFFQPAYRFVTLSPEELYQELQEFHADYAGEIRRSLAKEWHTIFLELERKCGAGKVKELVATALEQWPENPADEWGTCAELLENFITTALTKDLSCRKAEFKKAGIEEYDGIRTTIEELVGRYKSSCVEDLGNEDLQNLVLSRNLARLFLHTAELYGQLRGGEADEDEAQLLDYADMEILSEKLVKDNSRMGRLLRERYRYLIIDEFQDTSQQQWNILQALCMENEEVMLPDRLFVVGDRKQGVYGFREANVALFSQVHRLITTTNATWNDSLGGVTMASNFRTDACPLNTINQVFERVLSSVDNEYGVEFEPLELMRTANEGCVDYLLAEPGENPETGEEIKQTVEMRRQQEATLVAAHISRLIASGDAKPADIVILCRKRSTFQPFESALQAQQIPVVTQQGVNMFHQPELADAVAALNAVVYPHRDLLFVHYLRSPGVGFTDDLLLKISRSPGRSFYEKAKLVLVEKNYRLDDEWHPITSSEVERLTFALQTLDRARALVGESAPHTVVSFVLEQLGLRILARSSYRGDQAVANLDKLLDVARASESLSFEDFLDYVESEGQNDRGTAESVDMITADAVKIMTIHAAKGLEFPVVYLPDLNSGVSGPGEQASGDGQNWMTLRLSADLRNGNVFLSDYFRMRAEQQSMAEERRVFYVAMTRCERHLILCASEGKITGRNSFFEMVEDEFTTARNNGTLITAEQFSEAELHPPPAPAGASPATTHLSRPARIEAALRAATALTASQKSQTSDGVFSSSMELLLLRHLAAGTDNELALQDAVLADSAEHWQYELGHYLKQLRQWVATDWETSSAAVRILKPLQLVHAGQVQVLTPHLSCGSQYGWFILPGADGIYARQQARTCEELLGSGARHKVITLEMEPAPVLQTATKDVPEATSNE